eukprot:CAMPEP_0178917018 /NCGR_PEP_ID=MMETSP0786-20121207/13001_1 /TAXON_ID=186022 /ORGANISM="Thalassionema frauenfeldii, Strain CCMP 1798" /LENGTH=290 /DNA_ID=CAMNT_0020590497 /DNA_START=95 /DNA_END=967 /DNA_ORIENTATION=+
MTMGIFCKSRKVRQLPLSRRRELGETFMSLKSREAIIDYLFESLERAQVLDPASCARIANDVLETKYYRLLLPDRFDCDEIPRLGSGPLEQRPEHECYCAICLSNYPIDGRWCTLACTHEFCLACIQDLAKRYRGGPFPCPACLSIQTAELKEKSMGKVVPQNYNHASRYPSKTSKKGHIPPSNNKTATMARRKVATKSHSPPPIRSRAAKVATKSSKSPPRKAAYVSPKSASNINNNNNKKLKPPPVGRSSKRAGKVGHLLSKATNRKANKVATKLSPGESSDNDEYDC